MKAITLTLGLIALLVIALIAGCSTSTMHTQTIPDAAYQQALKQSDPDHYNVPAPGSAEEAAMLQAVKDLFTDYTHDNLAENTTRVYAETVYFRDAFRLITTVEDIRTYLLEGLEPIEAAEFIFTDVARSGDEFYLSWTMRLDFKKTPSGSWEESIGMTRMRFNSEGKVIFHQDYWDPTDIVYQRIPIARQLIGYVKKKL